LKIAIVGGSAVGLFAALTLARLAGEGVCGGDATDR